jgi:hypothetical protein
MQSIEKRQPVPVDLAIRSQLLAFLNVGAKAEAR